VLVIRALGFAVSDQQIQIRYFDALDRCSPNQHHLDTRAGAVLYPFNPWIICTN